MAIREGDLSRVAVMHAAAEKAVIRIGPPGHLLSLDLKEVWAYRELLYFLIWRDIKVRYKQTALGVAWVILQPVLQMVVFTMFARMTDIPSDGVPYAVFSYSGLLPWNLFAGALGRSSVSLVSQANLITKVYFPRLLVPLSATVSGVIDFAIAFVVLLGLMTWYGIHFSWNMLAVPGLLVLALLCALAVGLWLTVFNVKFRDVAQGIPFFIQLWMFASPVVYPSSLIQSDLVRLVYSLNPMAGVVEGFRWALLGSESPDLRIMGVSTAVLIVLLIGGLMYFKKMEQSFADVV